MSTYIQHNVFYQNSYSRTCFILYSFHDTSSPCHSIRTSTFVILSELTLNNVLSIYVIGTYGKKIVMTISFKSTYQDKQNQTLGIRRYILLIDIPD